MSARLLDVEASGVYLGVSPWTIRSWIAEGHLRPVELPSTRSRRETNRRVLLDRIDLDTFVERCKGGPRT
jgi:hypothetical protein